MVRYRNINYTDEATCFKTSDGFNVFNRNSEDFFGIDEMELLNRLYASPTAVYPCINNELTEATTPLPNLKNYLEIYTSDIGNPMTLSNHIFLEEDQNSLSTPINLEQDETDLNLKVTNASTDPNITLD